MIEERRNCARCGVWVLTLVPRIGALGFADAVLQPAATAVHDAPGGGYLCDACYTERTAP